jgi:hypothetical protein
MQSTKRILTTLILTLLFTNGTLSQNTGSKIDGKSGRLKKDTPGVYLTAERVDKDSGGQNKPKRIWFRLRNNTLWGIRVEASGGNSLIEDARMFYDVLDKKENILLKRLCHVCSHTVVGTGKTILFTVPFADTDGSSFLRVNFSYEWEDLLDVASGREARHYVYFYFENLP